MAAINFNLLTTSAMLPHRTTTALILTNSPTTTYIDKASKEVKHNPTMATLSSSLMLAACILTSLPITSFSSSSTRSSMTRGSSLHVEDKSDLLFSQDKSFTAGFYEVGTNAYCFAVWFTITNRTAVWAANRDQPVNGKGSKLSLLNDGSLVLLDFGDSPIWMANSNLTVQANTLELLNTGNLVLTDPSGNLRWQSFDSPTDTLLPLQPITKRRVLVSASRKGSLFSGYYGFLYDNDNVLRLKYDGPDLSSVYWPNPDNNAWANGRRTNNSSRFGVLSEEGSFWSSDKMSFNASDIGLRVKRRLTLDYDGNLRLYSLDESTASWSITWQALSEMCKIHGLCGRNGVCVYTPAPKCSCPVGYERQDPTDWFKGCRPKFKLGCEYPRQEVKFVKVAHTDFYGYDANFSEGKTLQGCLRECETQCNCDGFVYRINGQGQCYTKFILVNGYQSPVYVGDMYLKVPKNLETASSPTLRVEDPVCRPKKEENFTSPILYQTSKEKSYTFLYWFVCAIGGVEALFVVTGWYYLYRGREIHGSVEQGYRAISRQFRTFTYAELKKATNKFKEELGRGGSGNVYKGLLDDARFVAVKKLANMSQGEGEFWAEVSTIGTIYHMNLVRMWGYCSEAANRLLVYEYIENGSLAQHLFTGSDPTKLLGWAQRFKIAVGTARGLAYLHDECLEWVIHCDVKPENILLDGDFEAKISDFGLAKLTRRGRFASTVSRIRGTKGYMAPEWASNLPITAKVDVYSYGVVLLEIVKGSRISSWVLEGEDEVELRKIISLAKSLKIDSEDESWIRDFVDTRLNDKYNRKQAITMINVALSCVAEDRSKRPTMDDVLQNLLKVEEEQVPS